MDGMMDGRVDGWMDRWIGWTWVEELTDGWAHGWDCLID